jgi:hypothetical protein
LTPFFPPNLSRIPSRALFSDPERMTKFSGVLSEQEKRNGEHPKRAKRKRDR